MNHRHHGLLILGLTHLLATPVLAQVDAGLQAIQDLSQVNGQALACQDYKSAARVKALMLTHAPKTARFGSAFEDGTQQAFLAQTRQEAVCPDTATMTTRIDALARRLQTSLPAAPASATTPGTQ